MDLTITRFFVLCVGELNGLKGGAVFFDQADVFIYFGSVHHADGDGVDGWDIKNIVNRISWWKFTTADHFHAINADVVFVHLFENRNNFFGGTVHAIACIIDAC